jgi:hypothetical protein
MQRVVNHFGARLGIKFFQVGFMHIRDNHQMSAGVGIAIQDDIGMFAAKGDEILVAVVDFLRQTENASFDFTILHIFHSPWGKKVFHKMGEL